MDYEKAVEYLYEATPRFERIGAAAYKPGLDTARSLAAAFGNPHLLFPTIHVAGTNGKGSTCHTLASVLQAAGYRTGLYTSPHLVDFRERVRVDGSMMPREAVAGFVSRYAGASPDLSPSFFELTTIMAFEWFARSEVDVAVIETGLGGRLDTTNIITPLLSVITNISLDHTAQLGNTPEAIAAEKAGIIKSGVPVVVGRADGAVRRVFEEAAERSGSRLTVASDRRRFASRSLSPDGMTACYHGVEGFGTLKSPLTGICQEENLNTVLAALTELRAAGFDIPDEAVRRGVAAVCTSTGLAGRWSVMSRNPLTVADTGHNIGGWQLLAPQIDAHPGPLHIVIGFVADKDISHILPLLPRRAVYHFTQPSTPRALPADVLAARARDAGLCGDVHHSVARAYRTALAEASPDALIYVGGSTYVVADFLAVFGVKSC